MAESIVYSIAIFIVSLFVLDFGVDKFIDYTVKLGKRYNINPGLIALLTVGGEWEELTVIIASVSQSQSKLAIGNVVGSCVSNILGAFCLGLIFSNVNLVLFDRSSRIYTTVAMGLTAVFVLFVAIGQGLGRFGGGLLILSFVGYVGCVGYAIWKGVVEAPVGDDCCGGCESDSEPDSDSEVDDAEEGRDDAIAAKEETGKKACCSSTTKPRNSMSGSPQDGSNRSISTFDDLDLESAPLRTITGPNNGPKKAPSTLYYVFQLLFGLATLSLSSYTLSHSISTIAGNLGLDATVLGSTVLSFATTLPEKLVSVVSSRRGESGIMVATTAGSNIFLVTLCAGVLFMSGDLQALKGSVGLYELGWVLLSAGVLGLVVLGPWGGRKWMGWAMLGIYVAFLVGEFQIGGGE